MDGIRKEAPSLHITIKINCNDFTYGGLNESESLAICKLLDQAGIDSIEVSGIRPHVNEGYFATFSSEVADEVSCPVIVVGGLRSLDTMEDIGHAMTPIMASTPPTGPSNPVEIS